VAQILFYAAVPSLGNPFLVVPGEGLELSPAPTAPSQLCPAGLGSGGVHRAMLSFVHEVYGKGGVVMNAPSKDHSLEWSWS